jgi:hypothetical protein
MMFTKIIGFLLGPWGKIIGVLAAVGLIWGHGYRTASDSWKAQLAAERAAFQEKIEKAEAADAMARAEDARTLAGMDAQIERLRDALKNADGICFDGDDAGKLRDLWNR